MALHPRADVDSDGSLLRGSFKAARLLSKGRVAGRSEDPSVPHAQVERTPRPTPREARVEGARMDSLDPEDVRLDAEEALAAAQDRGYESEREALLATARAQDPAKRTAWERFEIRSEETKNEPSRFGNGPEAQAGRLAYLARHGARFTVREVATCHGGRVDAVLRRARRDLDRRLSSRTRCRVCVTAPRRPSCQQGRKRRRGVTRRCATRAGPGEDADAEGDEPGPELARAAR
jgi:hypothetical protein